MPRVKTPSAAQVAAREAGAARLRAAAEKRKHVAPVVIRKETAAPAEQVDAGVVTGAEGIADLKVEAPTVETAANVSKEQLERLAFMAELVKISIHETAEEQADPRFSVGVNGRQWHFSRGQEYTVPRFVVEGLARAKPISYMNQEYVKEDGSRSVRWPTKTGLRYGFSVMEDSARGREWLKQVLREP